MELRYTTNKNSEVITLPENTSCNVKYCCIFVESIPQLHISYKPQKISPKSQGIVRQLLHEKIRDAYVHPQFVTDVMKPLKIDDIMDQEVQNLSGGELQRVALALCLGKPADVYLIDEPSAYLDSEQRLVAAKVIKRYLIFYPYSINKNKESVKVDTRMITYDFKLLGK